MIYWYPVSFLMLRMYMAFLVGPDIPVSLNILILVFVVSGSWDKYLYSLLDDPGVFYNCLPVVFYNFRWWWSLVSSILPLFSHLSTHPPSWRRSLLHSYVEYSSWRCFDSVSSRLVVINGRALGPLRNVSFSWSSIELTLPLSKLSYPVMVIRSPNLG